MYDFEHDSNCVMHISDVILHLKKYMEENPVSYPPAMLVYTTLWYGLVPVLNTECKHDNECRITGGGPVGGLADTIETLDECLECLDLELDYEVPSHQYPADYQI
jgi:hypothetical protein